jgi:hypothetical protein
MFLHNLLNVLVQIANKMDVIQKSKWTFHPGRHNTVLYYVILNGYTALALAFAILLFSFLTLCRV